MSENNDQISLDSVSSLAADAFSRLTQLQDELKRRLQAVAVREGTLDALQKNLDTRATELKAFAEKLEQRSKELDAQHAQRSKELDQKHGQRCKELDQKEADALSRVGRREEVVVAFQEMLAHMHAALDDMSSDSIIAALDAGTAYEDRAVSERASTPPAANGAAKAASNGTSRESEAPAKPAIGLTADEQKLFFSLRDKGKSDGEILAGIYAARQQHAPA